jgi:hypothetical protein
MYNSKNTDQKKIEQIYANCEHKKTSVKEGISGIYPEMTMAQEFGSAIFLAAMFILPVILEKIRQKLSEPQLKELAKRVVSMVKQDNSKDALKVKISRAIDNILQKITHGKTRTLQPEIQGTLPDDMENKSEVEISKETKARLSDLKRRDQKYNL